MIFIQYLDLNYSVGLQNYEIGWVTFYKNMKSVGYNKDKLALGPDKNFAGQLLGFV